MLLEKKFLGNFPIMLFSDRCILKNLEPIQCERLEILHIKDVLMN